MKLTVTIVVCFIALVQAKNIPNYISLCKRTDPALNKCLKDSVNKLRPYLLKGIPEFRIPPYDPLRIPQVQLNEGSGAVVFKATFKNINVFGASQAEVRDVDLDLKNLQIAIDLHFPTMRLESDYDLDGRILVVPVKGHGATTANFTDVSALVKLSGNSISRRGRTFVTLKDRYVDLEIGSAKVHFDNLFNGNKQLGDTTNRFFNEHWRDIMLEIRPVLEDTISEVVHAIVRQVFDNFPIEQLLPES